MEKIVLPYETAHNDLVGSVSINIRESFNEFAASLAGYDKDRFEAVAMRFFMENNPIVTFYALDKERAQRKENDGKLPVHKFKREIQFEAFFKLIKEFDFTVTSGQFNIEEMEVINK